MITQDDSHQALIDTFVRTAGTLPASHVQSLAAVLAAAPSPDPALSARALAAVPNANYRQLVTQVLAEWSLATPGLSGAAVALALRSAHTAHARTRAEQRLEIVWTGPSTQAVPVRRTHEVMLEIIDAAQQRLIIVSFAAYKVDSIVEALKRAIARGVEIRLILEAAEASGGRLSHDASRAFASLGDAVKVYVWAADQRAGADGATGAMHAKAIIADSHIAFVTSANLTGSALTANMELGLLAEDGNVPERLTRHFGELIERGTLCRVTH